ncbi:hypothetical protein JSY14_12035 [Brachybacterium sp. EF45031]|uniref:hypothetical protein n=1 Tax=Brachybacterium sillae TaxID=2810536 RepID=UPI00217ECCDA|nr:hypothetical protein [Brachybacterium sillae]MCS6712707.1 hypothetical protein [Brachybacterium sillae]
MPCAVAVLTEVPLTSADAQSALDCLGLSVLDPDDPVAQMPVHVLVPARRGTSLIRDSLAELPEGSLEQQWRDLTTCGEASPASPAGGMDAEAVLAAASGAFRAVGCRVEGEVSDGDVLQRVDQLLEECALQTVVVRTCPRSLPRDFADSWAHHLEDRLGATVLHLDPATTVPAFDSTGAVICD